MSIDELINLAMQEEYGKTQHSGGWEELHIPTLKHGIELAITEALRKYGQESIRTGVTSGEHKDKVLQNIAISITEAQKKLDKKREEYNQLMDADGVDDRRDDSGKDEVEYT